MAQLTCELCGSTDFVKDEGVFVCQGCGTKYTVEEAKRMMAAQEPAPSGEVDVAKVVVDAVASVVAAVSEQISAPEINSVDDFQPQNFNPVQPDPRGVNNYICQGWQFVMNDYNNTEHPSAEQQNALVERAKECLVMLDNATMLDPNNIVQNLLIYQNCAEIVDSVQGTYHEVQQEDGTWKRERLPFNTKLEIPGQRETWDEKRDNAFGAVRQIWINAHPDEQEERAQLEEQARGIEEQLGDLKDEKRSKGFFNFAEKREVKERMAPVKEELREVRGQINEIDKHADAYVESQLEAIGATYVRLDF